MRLPARTVVTSLVLAVPAAALVTTAVELLRSRDLAVALDRVVRSQLNEQVRERCESDPNWFITGPLEGRPRRGETGVDPANPDALAPRPKITDQPFELYAYDELFRGSSSAAPRFPNDFRRDLQRASGATTAAFDTNQGRGTQMAIPTGWIGSPCMYFLGRMRPPAGQLTTRVEIFLGCFALTFAVTWLAQAHLVARARRLAADLQSAIKENYASVAPDTLKDELSSVTFMYNDTATELHQRRARIDDQDELLRRHVTHSVDEVTPPLGQVEQDLASLAASAHDEPTRVKANDALARTHQAASRLESLAGAARLRLSGEVPRARLDLRAVVERVAAQLQPLARSAGVTMTVKLPPDPIAIDADESLIARAIGNLVENAIGYNRRGGMVSIVARPDAIRGFALTITDTGRSVSDEELKGLTAVRRFRGDESHNRRPNTPGLGIALAREVTDRFGLHLELRRPVAGGFEAEITRRA